MIFFRFVANTQFNWTINLAHLSGLVHLFENARGISASTSDSLKFIFFIEKIRYYDFQMSIFEDKH